MNAFDSENKESRKYPPLAVSCLTALGEFLGGEVVLNEDDCFNVAVEDENPVTIHLDAEQEKFELVGMVADDLPDPVDYSLVLDLLNFALSPLVNGGPAVGRDPATGRLEAFLIIPFRDLTPQDFVTQVKEFFRFQITITLRITHPDEPVGDDYLSADARFSGLEI